MEKTKNNRMILKNSVAIITIIIKIQLKVQHVKKSYYKL